MDRKSSAGEGQEHRRPLVRCLPMRKVIPELRFRHLCGSCSFKDREIASNLDWDAGMCRPSWDVGTVQDRCPLMHWTDLGACMERAGPAANARPSQRMQHWMTTPAMPQGAPWAPERSCCR